MLPAIPELILTDSRPESRFPLHPLPGKPDTAAQPGDRLVLILCHLQDGSCAQQVHPSLLACLDGVHVLHPLTPPAGLLAHLESLCHHAGLGLMLDSEHLPANFPLPSRPLPCRLDAVAPEDDPILPGALLVSCAPDTLTEVLSLFLQQGFDQIQVIGIFSAGETVIEIV